MAVDSQAYEDGAVGSDGDSIHLIKASIGTTNQSQAFSNAEHTTGVVDTWSKLSPPDLHDGDVMLGGDAESQSGSDHIVNNRSNELISPDLHDGNVMLGEEAES